MACKYNLQMDPHNARNLHMPLTIMQVTVPFYWHVYRSLIYCIYYDERNAKRKALNDSSKLNTLRYSKTCSK
jgi:hypothetical protein